MVLGNPYLWIAMVYQELVDCEVNLLVYYLHLWMQHRRLLSSCLNLTLELFGCSELSGVRKYRRLLDVWTDFGFSFDTAPTIDMVLYFGVSKMSEMNEDKIEIDR